MLAWSIVALMLVYCVVCTLWVLHTKSEAGFNAIRCLKLYRFLKPDEREIFDQFMDEHPWIEIYIDDFPTKEEIDAWMQEMKKELGE